MFNHRDETSPINLVASGAEGAARGSDGAPMDVAARLASEQVTLKDLERLLALNNANSYTEAAYRLQISEAHLRRKIRAMEKAVGFILIEKKDDRRLGLSRNATQWLKSFRELHNALKNLDIAIQNAQQLSRRLHIGLDPYLSFSHTLWELIPKTPNSADGNQWIFHPGGELDKVLSGDFEAYLGVRPVQNEHLISRLVYRDNIVIYRQKEGTTEQEDENITNVILQAPVTETQIRELLAADPEYKNKELNFTRAANATEALQYVSYGIGIFPSIALSPHIVPANVEASSTAVEAYADVYLICNPASIEQLLQEDIYTKLSSPL